MNYRKLLGLVVTAVLFLSTGMLSAQEPPEEFQQLYQEYMTINQELQIVQQEAMQDPEIVQQSDDFSAYIDNKLKDKGDEVAVMVDERNEVIDQIEAAREEGNTEAEQELHPRYQEISQKLQPYIQEVFQEQEVQERQMRLENLLMDKMNEIDPETENKMNRLEEITEKLQQMMG